MTPLAITSVAYHEAGHAVIALALDLDLRGVSVIQQSHSSGQTKLAKKLGAYAPWRLAIYIHAGPEAQRHFTGREPDAAQVATDMHTVTELLDLTRKASGPSVQDLTARYRAMAYAMIISHEGWIRAVAAALMQRKALSGDEVLGLQPGLAEMRR
jgi:hypothetical protein